MKHVEEPRQWPGPGRWSFSVSHSGDVGAVLLRPGAAAVGVDLEEHKARPFLRLAKRYFTEEEQRQLQRLSEKKKKSDEGNELNDDDDELSESSEWNEWRGDEKALERRFFEMWTQKEAWLKTSGEGLAGGLKALEATEQVVRRSGHRIESLRVLKGHSLAASLPHGTALQVDHLSPVGWPHLLRCIKREEEAPPA